MVGNYYQKSFFRSCFQSAAFMITFMIHRISNQILAAVCLQQQHLTSTKHLLLKKPKRPEQMVSSGNNKADTADIALEGI